MGIRYSLWISSVNSPAPTTCLSVGRQKEYLETLQSLWLKILLDSPQHFIQGKLFLHWEKTILAHAWNRFWMQLGRNCFIVCVGFLNSLFVKMEIVHEKWKSQ